MGGGGLMAATPTQPGPPRLDPAACPVPAGQTLYAAPDHAYGGDWVYYVTKTNDLGHFYIRGFRLDSDRQVTYPAEVYGPTTLEGARAFFAGRRHNNGGGSVIPARFKVAA
jgi:hypothetical protein